MRKMISRIMVVTSIILLWMSGFITMRALAMEGDIVSEIVEVEEVETVVDTLGENIRTGTLGQNDGIQWVYDESTKTLQITGKDSEVYGTYNSEIKKNVSPFYDICSDVEHIVISNCSISGWARYLFADLEQLKDIEMNNFDTSQITNMGGMFHSCYSLTCLDLSCFDTSKVKRMGNMFGDCKKLESIDVSSFNTSQVTDMSFLFAGCESLTSVDISNLDTSQVTNLTAMFQNCKKIESIDVSNFDTLKVVNMGGMFSGCKSLSSIDVSGFDTSQTTHMGAMFQQCSKLQSINVSGFDTSKAIDMSAMFSICSNLTSIDLSNFDTSQVTDMRYMFQFCSRLTNLDMSNFDTSQLTMVDGMFDYCNKLSMISTPKNMVAGQSIALPGVFYDTNQNSTSELSLEFCNETLLKEGNSVGRNIKIEAISSELTVNGTMQLLLNIDGEVQDMATNTGFSWSVVSEEVAVVSNSGLVTGVGMGSTVITCVNKNNPLESASYEVMIKTPFSDIKVTDWQYPYVIYAYENNIMSGKGDGKFDMNGKLTRSEFVTVLYSYIGKPSITFKQYFPDVSKDGWYALAVTWAKQTGITAGNADGNFGTNNNITREQLVVMLYQFAKMEGIATGTTTTNLSTYKDAGKVSSWASEALTWAVQNGIISGKGGNGVFYLDPQGNTTRGECATMMMRYVELVK